MMMSPEIDGSKSPASWLRKNRIHSSGATEGDLINRFSNYDVGSDKIKVPIILPTNHEIRVPYFIQKSCYMGSISSWISKFQDQLKSLRSLKDDWNGYGSLAPNNIALINSQTVLDILHQMKFSPMAIAPSAEDGIAISFAKAKKNAIIECYNDGDILAITYKGAEEPELMELGDSTSEIAEALDRIYIFLYGR
jgi:hypothetical protein